MPKALIVVDVQNDFVTGSLAVEGATQVALDISEYVNKHRDDYALIVATKDAHIDAREHFKDWPIHCLDGAWGAEFAPELIVKFDEVFYKGAWSAAYSGFEGRSRDGGELETYLDSFEIDQVDICGIALDYCVKATAIDSAELTYDTVVLLDLVAAVSDENASAAIDEMAEYNIGFMTVLDY